METPATKSIGERRVRIDFNPSNQDSVYLFKRACAELINEAERIKLRNAIAQREPFLDYVFRRVDAKGEEQTFQVSGEPMFDRHSRFIGYRGIGVELTSKH